MPAKLSGSLIRSSYRSGPTKETRSSFHKQSDPRGWLLLRIGRTKPLRCLSNHAEKSEVAFNQRREEPCYVCVHRLWVNHRDLFTACCKTVFVQSGLSQFWQ